MSLTLVIPARNEAAFLPLVLRTAHKRLPPGALLVLADSASSDATSVVVERLMRDLPQLRYVRASEPGKGLAVKTAWHAYPAETLAFMDADLSTDLEALERLVVKSKDADVVVGTRRHSESRVSRTWLRQFVSFGFYRALKWYFPDVPCSDTTCGFKAIRGEIYEKLAPSLKSSRFFFDTEIVLHAHARGARVAELPISWNENALPDRRTSVRIFRVAREYLQGLKDTKKQLI